MANTPGMEYKMPQLKGETLMHIRGALIVLLANQDQRTLYLDQLHIGRAVIDLKQRVVLTRYPSGSVGIKYTTLKVPERSSEVNHSRFLIGPGQKARQIHPMGESYVALDDSTALAVAKDLDSQIPDQPQ